MIQITQLARRALPLLVLALATGACDRPDPTEPLTSSDPIADAVASPQGLSFASSFRGGIPFGVFHLPMNMYGEPYSAALLNISSYTSSLLPYLQAARQSGLRVVLSFVGAENYYQNRDRTLNLEKWKKRVDAYRGIDFSSYLADGTIIGHYIVDEPHDPVNWGGKPIPKSTIDEMARHSKRLWPTMPVIVRTYATWMKGYKWKYVDAAWAQYSARHGSVSGFIEKEVRAAKESGLALVSGFNLSNGGDSGLTGYFQNPYAMGPRELRDWGSVLLAHPYICAFVMWKYDSRYLGRSDVKSAMANLSQKARNHPSRSCRGNATDKPPSGGGADDDDDDEGNGTPAGGNEQPGGGGVTPGSITLAVTGSRSGGTQYMLLRWSGAAGSKVDVYRNGKFGITTENDNRYTNSRVSRDPATYVYKLCERGSAKCSDEVTVTIR
jgi:hypothetical protein